MLKNCTVVGDHAAKKLVRGKNNVILGHHAVKTMEELSGVLVIGDAVEVYENGAVAVGITLFGNPISQEHRELILNNPFFFREHIPNIVTTLINCMKAGNYKEDKDFISQENVYGSNNVSTMPLDNLVKEPESILCAVCATSFLKEGSIRGGGPSWSIYQCPVCDQIYADDNAPPPVKLAKNVIVLEGK